MFLRYLLTSTAILLFWVLSLPQNKPEREAWTSMELCEPLITPPGFPEWQSLCFILPLGSQGLKEVLGLVNASLASGEEPGVDMEPWGGLSSCKFTSHVWDTEEITSRSRRGRKHSRSATAKIPISSIPLGRGERSKAPLKSLFFPEPFPHLARVSGCPAGQEPGG